MTDNTSILNLEPCFSKIDKASQIALLCKMGEALYGKYPKDHVPKRFENWKLLLSDEFHLKANTEHGAVQVRQWLSGKRKVPPALWVKFYDLLKKNISSKECQSVVNEIECLLDLRED